MQSVSRVVLASELTLASAFDTLAVPERDLHGGTVRLEEAAGVSRGRDPRQSLPDRATTTPAGDRDLQALGRSGEGCFGSREDVGYLIFVLECSIKQKSRL